MKLTPQQQVVVEGALHTAAERYRECAKAIGESTMAKPARDRLVEQFIKHADDCGKVLEVLDTNDGPVSAECPVCHWGLLPSELQRHIREKH